MLKPIIFLNKKKKKSLKIWNKNILKKRKIKS